MPQKFGAAPKPQAVGLGRVIGRAQGDAARVIERVLARLAEVPEASKLAGMPAAEAVTGLVDALFTLLAETEKGTDAEPSPERTSHLRRLVQTVPAPAFFALHHLAIEEVWFALEEAIPRDQLTSRQSVAETALAVFLRATREVQGAFRSERETTEPRGGFDLDVFVKRLLDDEFETTEFEEAARRLDIGRQSETTALAFRHAGDDPGGPHTMPARAAAILAAIGCGDSRVARYRETVIALLNRPFDGRALEAAIARAKPPCQAGLGIPAMGVAGLRRTTREAMRALEIARAAATPGRVHRYRDLAVYDLIRSGGRFSRIVGRRLLNGLPDDKKALTTLREFCRQGYNVKLTAAALGIHPHTLTYRLGGISKRYGIELGSPEGRFSAHTALLAIEVEGLQPPPRETTPGKTDT